MKCNKNSVLYGHEITTANPFKLQVHFWPKRKSEKLLKQQER